MSREGDGPEQRTRKVAIVGTAPHWKRAPFGDESWEIWSCAQLWSEIPRWDAWFEIHSIPFMQEREAKGDRSGHLEWLAQDHGDEKVIYTRGDVARRIPNGVPYPLEVIKETFPAAYFNNTVSYMLALAIYQRVDQVGLWGVDMALSSEYGHQRPSCEYYIGIARGMGIQVHIPPQADLLKVRRLYGFDDPDQFEKILSQRKDELQEKLQKLNQQQEQMTRQIERFRGALEQTKWDEQCHMHK